MSWTLLRVLNRCQTKFEHIVYCTHIIVAIRNYKWEWRRLFFFRWLFESFKRISYVDHDNWVITECQDVYLHKNLTGNPRNKLRWVNLNENFEDKHVRPSGGFDIVDVGNVSPSEGPLDNEQPEPFGESWGLGDIWYVWMIVPVYQKLCENWICCPTH